VQTHDDDVEKDSQTEEITSRDKWTQHPTGVDLAPFGGQRFMKLALELNLCVKSPVCHYHWWVGVRNGIWPAIDLAQQSMRLFLWASLRRTGLGLAWQEWKVHWLK